MPKKPGDMLKNLSTGTTKTDFSNLAKHKPGSKLKKLANGSRPNLHNPGCRTKNNGKTGRRRAAMLD